jgi:F0F1-type ATP synthase membrane subunit b/b'
MLAAAAAVAQPAARAVQQATNSANLHFWATTALITAVGAVLAFFVKRLIDQNDARYEGLSDELHETNKNLNALAVNLAALTGEIAGAEKANVAERARVRARERD